MRNRMKVLLVCAGAAIAWSNAGVVAAPPARSFTSGNFVLEIDGIHAGLVLAAEGGLAFSDVVKEAGEEFFFKKHIGNPGYRDIRLEFAGGMDKSVYDAIALALQGQGPRLNGALLRTDFNGKVISRLEFVRAQITAVTFPAADATSKNTARFSIVLTPEQTYLARGASGVVAKSTAKQKNMLESSFRLSIDGLNTTRVSKVEAMTVRLPLISGSGGTEFCLRCQDFVPINPTRVDFPNVVISLADDAKAVSVYDWFDDFVISGNNDDSREKNGTLEFLTPDQKSTLFTIKFKNLGIFELMPLVDESTAATRLMAAMYCESMEFLAQ